MTKKSIISVEVDDSKFRQFNELFQKYAGKVEELPDDWKKVVGATAQAGSAMDSFGDITGTAKESLAIAAIEAAAIGKSVAEAIKAQKEFTVAARGGNTELASMAKHAKALGVEVFGIGKFLMKLGALGIGTAALGTIFSGLGLRDLADSSLRGQGAARRIGVTQGQLAAFQTDYGRYVDPSLLNRVADAQSDLSKVSGLSWALGKSVSSVQGMGADHASIALAQKAHDWYNNTPASMRNAQGLSATGLNRFFSMEEVRKLGLASGQELSQAASNYSKDAGSFNVSNRANDAWFGFTRQIAAAGKIIQSDLTERLAALAPELKKFISAMSGDAKILIDDVLSPANLKAAGTALGDFTKWVGSDDMKKELKRFSTDLGEITNGMDALAKVLGGISPALTSYDKANAAFNKDIPMFSGGNGKPLHFNPDNPLNQAAQGKGPYWAWVSKFWADKLGVGTVPGSTVSADLLAAQIGVESSGNPGAHSPAGAMGLMQLMPGTAKDLGVTNPYDQRQSIAAGARYDNMLLKKYRGDIRKTLAAYDWGQGNVDKDIRANGKNWESHLPGETQRYINKVLTALAGRSAVNLNVSVTNPTSARVALSLKAAGATLN